MRSDRAALQQALHELNSAALTSRNPGIVALSHRLSQERSLPPKANEPQRERKSVVPETQSRTVSEYLAGVESLEERARQALQVLGHYAGISEGYLYLESPTGLQLTAALQEHAPPESLTSGLQLMAAGTSSSTWTQIAEDYCAYRLEDGVAVLRAANTQTIALPDTLMNEVGLSLRRVAARAR